jgi:hypothetical protein
MLKIFIGDQRVKLFKNTLIALNLNSQVFTKKTAYSFPFKIPRKENIDIFGSLYDLGIKKQNTGEACFIEHGSFYIEGRVYIRNITKGSVELSFIQEPIKNFFEKIKKTKVNDIEYKEDLPAESNRLNYYNDPPDANGDHNYNFAFAPVDITSEHVLNYMEEKQGSAPQAVICNYRQKIYEAEYYTDENYDEIIRYFTEWHNGYSGGDRQAEDNADSDNMIWSILTPLMPFWRLKFVAQKIAEHLGFNISENCIKDKPIFNNTLIFAMHPMVINTGVMSDGGQKASFKYLPNITIKEFFERLEKDLNIITLFDFVTQTISFKQKKDIILSNDEEMWSYPYRILSSKLAEKENLKYTFEELGYEVKFAKENGIFNDYETGSDNQKEKNIKSTSLPSQVEIKSERSNNYYLQGWYTYQTEEMSFIQKTVYAKYDIPHAIIKPNGPLINQGQSYDYIPEDQPLRFLVYNYAYDNKDRRAYWGSESPLGSESYTGESYNFGHYRFYDGNESLDAEDGSYTGLHENFFQDELTWRSTMKRKVELSIQIPLSKLQNFDFTKKRYIGSDKFLFRDIALKLTNDQIIVDKVNAYTIS